MVATTDTPADTAQPRHEAGHALLIRLLRVLDFVARRLRRRWPQAADLVDRIELAILLFIVRRERRRLGIVVERGTR